ncbi:uncharacterized protein V1516DRAFT_622729 [Lipomyces oligophaga]|uniref:uncharacterized protein n=1 Tax=Lipomyces oligophaga TaxID=45792 RepID=UPI0034CFD6CE
MKTLELTAAEILERNIRRQYFADQQLAKLQNPLSSLAYCSDPNTHKQANYLVDAVTPEGYLARIDFRLNRPIEADFYNPNLIPYPKGSKYPYLAIVRMSPKVAGLYHHELAYCDLRWARTRTIHRKVLECATPGIKMNFGKDWKSLDGACRSFPFLQLYQGHTDPRVFFSPHGEPLMVVGSNGKSKKNCLGQFIIDLRVVIPNLATKMNIKHLPIRFPVLTELSRPDLKEIEKNWFVMYDALDSDKEYLHYDFQTRALAPMDVPANPKQYKLIGQPTPKLITGLLQNLKKGDYAANDLHQSTNSLLVTLCDFPCIPTIHNTVMIEIFHVKYLNYYELYYRRYLVVMNATAPFNILGRTENIMYAGTDPTKLVYTVSMVWNSGLYPTHKRWDDDLHGGREIWAALDSAERAKRKLEAEAEAEDFKLKQAHALENSVDVSDYPLGFSENDEVDISKGMVARGLRKRDSSGLAISSEIQSLPSIASLTTEIALATKSTTSVYTRPTPIQRISKPNQNPFVSDRYHGWLDDILLINFGIEDRESGTIHVRARELLECIKVVE